MNTDTKLYINGILADLGEAVISETKQINNFFEIQDRQTSFTSKFILPFTPINKKIYDLLAVRGIESEAPYRIGTAIVVRKGIPTIQNGRIMVTKFTNGKGYESNIQYGNISMFDEISKKKVSELDFSSINHPFNELNYENSFIHTHSDGYIYALADYGLLDTADVEIDYQVPSLFRRWVWDKIFSEAGYVYSYVGTDNVFESKKFIDSIMTITEGFVIETDIEAPELLVQLRGIETTSQAGDNNMSTQELFDKDDIHDYLDFTRIGVISPNQDSYYQINIAGTVTSTENMSIIVLKNRLEFFRALDNSTGAVNFSDILYLTVNDEITFITVNESGNEYSYTLALNFYKDNNTAIINFQSFFDNLSQKDFIKSVIQDYGPLMQKKKDSNVYEFININEMFSDIDNAEDWSGKFDKQLSEEYKVGNYAKKNFMRYKYNADEDFSDGSFPIDNETIKDEVTLFTSIFRAVKTSSNTKSGEFMYFAPLFSVDRNDDGTVKEVKSSKGASYIMNLNRIDTDLTYNLSGGLPTVYNGIVPFGNSNGLNYSEIISTYYSIFQANMQVPIKRKVRMVLSALDVYNLDFFNLVYIKQFMSYFYVNKIQGFKTGKTTNVELIRVLGSLDGLGGEYSDDYNEDYNI